MPSGRRPRATGDEVPSRRLETPKSGAVLSEVGAEASLGRMELLRAGVEVPEMEARPLDTGAEVLASVAEVLINIVLAGTKASRTGGWPLRAKARRPRCAPNILIKVEKRPWWPFGVGESG